MFFIFNLIVGLIDGVYGFIYEVTSVDIKKWHITYIMYNRINTKI